VDVHVGQIRRKLGRPELIRTVRGAGYKVVA
jgi:DNA-binding response OmpR family regulator